jgi:hypothetical protein
MSGRDDPTGYLVLGTCAGIFFFYKGFRVYREFRVVEDTPEMPIRSIPMGLVSLHGRAMGEQLVTSPVTGTPCFYYKVEIQKWEVKGRSEGWSPHGTDLNGVLFYLDDGTGKVMVDAQSAELDLVISGVREIGGTLTGLGALDGASNSGSGASDEDLRKYVSQVEVKRASSVVSRGLAALPASIDPEKDEKRQVVVQMFAQGTGSAELFKKAMDFEGPFIERQIVALGGKDDPAHEQIRSEAQEAFRHPLGTPEFVEHMRKAVEAQHDPEQMQKFTQAMETLQRAQQGGLDVTMSAAPGRFRFTEYCLVPDQTYVVTGTCVENPNPKGEHDRNMIVKGQSEPTFLISCQTEKQVESTLRHRAALYIFGGAGLSIICVALLLLRFGWL